MAYGTRESQSGNWCRKTERVPTKAGSASRGGRPAARCRAQSAKRLWASLPGGRFADRSQLCSVPPGLSCRHACRCLGDIWVTSVPQGKAGPPHHRPRNYSEATAAAPPRSGFVQTDGVPAKSPVPVRQQKTEATPTCQYLFSGEDCSQSDECFSMAMRTSWLRVRTPALRNSS